MDIRIILNSGAVETQPSKVSKKTPRQGNPTSGQSYPRSTNQRASSRSPLAGREPSGRKTNVKRHSTLRQRQPPASSSSSTRQSRPRKRRVVAPEEEGTLEEGELCSEGAKWTTPAKKRRRDSSTQSSVGSSTVGAQSPSLASLLLTRAKQQRALEAATTLGPMRRSIMDVVMDLKGEGGESREEALLVIAERTSRGGAAFSQRQDYLLTDEDGLKAYWADQAVIWDGALDSSSDGEDYGGGGAGARILTRFPVSMERSTATGLV